MIKIMFTCFTYGQTICKSEWKDDNSVVCPKCHRKLYFDGDDLFNDDGQLALNIVDKQPSGHFFRYDLAHEGFKSLRFTGKPKPIDYLKEYEFALQRISAYEEGEK